MRLLGYVLVCFFIAPYLSDQSMVKRPAPVWSWIGGSGEGEASNIFYNDSMAYPGSRRGSSWWSDGIGHMLMFGGDAYVEDDELWTYDVNTNSWSIVPTEGAGGERPGPQRYAVMCGSEADGRLVLISGIDKRAIEIDRLWQWDMVDSGWSEITDLDRKPSRRWMPQNWCNSDAGVFYLFGGYAKSRSDSESHYPDGMWKFDIAALQFEEIVLNGSSPVPRYGGATWLDINSNSLWLMGGMHKNGALNDLWRFDINENYWEEIRPSVEQTGLYGDVRVASSQSHPGSRTGALTWSDECGNLWLFGGSGYGAPPEPPIRISEGGLLNDLWMYLKNQNVWVWMGGSKEEEGAGTYGDLMASSPDFFPSPRTHGVAWSVNNTAYLFGGNGHNMHGSDSDMNDLWQLDMSGQCGWTLGSGGGETQFDINSTAQTTDNSETVPVGGTTNQSVTMETTVEFNKSMEVASEFPVDTEPAIQVVESTQTPSEHVGNATASVSGVGMGTELVTDGNRLASPSASSRVVTTHEPKSVSIATEPETASLEGSQATSTSVAMEVSPSEQSVAKANSHTGSESTIQFENEPSSQTVGESTSQIPSEPATEVESVSSSLTSSEPIAHNRNRPAIQTEHVLSSQISDTPTAHNSNGPTSQPGRKVLLQTDSDLSSQTVDESTAQTPSEASTNPGFETAPSEASTNPGFETAPSEASTNPGFETAPSEASTNSRFETTSQTSSTATTLSRSKPTTQAKDEDTLSTEAEEPQPVIVQISSESTHEKTNVFVPTEPTNGEESTSQATPMATTHMSNTIMTEVENRHSSQAVDFGITKSPPSEESEPGGLQTKPAIKTTQKSTDKITSESATTEANMEELTSQVTPHVSTTVTTEAETKYSSQAVDFRTTRSPLSQTEPVGLHTEPPVKTTQKSVDKITSESATTEAATQRETAEPAVFDIPQLPDESHVWNQMEPVKSTVMEVPKLPDESHMGDSMSKSSSSSGWFGSRRAVPYITAALVAFAVVLFVVGVLIGKPCCRQKRKRQRYDYQKVASDDVTEWQ